jgi:hypothetical protein
LKRKKICLFTHIIRIEPGRCTPPDFGFDSIEKIFRLIQTLCSLDTALPSSFMGVSRTSIHSANIPLDQ